MQTNVLGTAHVLDACRAEPALERVVLTSTSEVYGTAQYVPIDEAHPLRGQSPYAATQDRRRCAGRELPPRLRPAGGDPAAVQHLRPAAVGPGDHPDDHQPGADAARSSGSGSLDPRRDLTYVKDTVAGFVAIAGCDAALGRAVNIGRGDDLTIGELVERIAARLGRPIRVETDAERVRPAASEVGRLLAGTDLARELWGWSPEVHARPGPRRDDRLGPRQPRACSGSMPTTT